MKRNLVGWFFYRHQRRNCYLFFCMFFACIWHLQLRRLVEVKSKKISNKQCRLCCRPAKIYALHTTQEWELKLFQCCILCDASLCHCRIRICHAHSFFLWDACSLQCLAKQIFAFCNSNLAIEFRFYGRVTNVLMIVDFEESDAFAFVFFLQRYLWLACMSE